MNGEKKLAEKALLGIGAAAFCAVKLWGDFLILMMIMQIFALLD